MHELQSLSSTSRAVWAQCELMEVVDGVLCICSKKSSSPQKHRVVLTGSLIQPALKQCQDALAGCHLGREKTLQKMKIRFWRPNLSRSVKEYCNDCLTCVKSKPRRKPKAPLQPIPSGYPMHRLHIDIVGPLLRTKRGSRFILTVQCSFTKWAEAYAIPIQRASTSAKVLVKNWICRFGVPYSMHSDQGRNFESTLFQKRVCCSESLGQDPQITIPKEMDKSRISIGL